MLPAGLGLEEQQRGCLKDTSDEAWFHTARQSDGVGFLSRPRVESQRSLCWLSSPEIRPSDPEDVGVVL